MRKLSEQEIELIEHLKQGFSGSSDYLSGVNDGMYQIAQYLTLIPIPTPPYRANVMESAKRRLINKLIHELQGYNDLEIYNDGIKSEGLNNDGLCDDKFKCSSEFIINPNGSVKHINDKP